MVRLDVVIAARENVKRAVTKANGELSKIGKGRAGAALGKLKGALSPKAIGLGVAGIVAGLGGIVKGNLDLADSIDKVNRRTGLSTEFLQRSRQAAELSGTSVDTLGKGWLKLTKNVADAGSGLTGAQDKLAALGLTFEDLEGKTPEEQLFIVGDALAQIEDPAAKAAAAQDLLGKSGVELIPLLGEEQGAFKAATEAVKDHTIISEENIRTSAATNDEFAMLGEEIKGTLTVAFQALLPAVSAIAKFLNRVLLPAVKSVGKFIGDNLIPILVVLTPIIGIKLVAAAKAMIAKVIALNAALLANPFALVVVALTALVAGIVIAYQKSETFRNIVNGVFEAIKAVVIPIINTVKTVVTEAWKIIFGLVKLYITPYKIAITTAFEVIKTLISVFTTTVPELLSGMWDKVVGAFNTVKDTITGIFKGAVNGYIGIWEGLANAIVGVVNKIIGVWNSLEFSFPGVNIPFAPDIPGFTVGLPDIPTLPNLSIPRLAEGGIVNSPTLALIGEAGPEAVVPLGKGKGTGNTFVVNIHTPAFIDTEGKLRESIETAAQEIFDQGGFQYLRGA